MEPRLALIAILVFVTVTLVSTTYQQELRKEVKQLFQFVDKDDNGVITSREMSYFFMQFFTDEDEEKLVITTEIQDALPLALMKMDKQWLKRRAQHVSEWKLTMEEFERTVAERSEFLVGSDATCPEQVHLAYGKDPSREMTVMWVTKKQTPQTQVLYHKDGETEWQVATGFNYTYHVGTLFKWDGWIHKVFLTNLEPSTTYHYSVNGGGSSCSSNKFTFSTTSVPGREQYPKSIAIYGDMGTIMPMGFAVTHSILAESRKTKFDLVVHVGDLAYAGTGSEREFEFIWDLFCNQVAPLSQYVPYMTSVGNHEKYFNFTSFNSRYHMPGDRDGMKSTDGSPPSLANFYYSFDFEGVHFTSMSTEHDHRPGSPQYTWIEYDLKKAVANRQSVPWIVVLGHRPMYSSDLSTDSGSLQKDVEPLLEKYKVDLAVWGHMHVYERTWPVLYNKPVQHSNITRDSYINPEAPVHLTIGNAGAYISEKWVEPQPAWSVLREQRYGFVRFTIQSRSVLYFQYIREHDGSVGDEFQIIKQ